MTHNHHRFNGVRLKLFQQFIKYLRASFSSFENSNENFSLMPDETAVYLILILICFPIGNVCNLVFKEIVIECN